MKQETIAVAVKPKESEAKEEADPTSKEQEEAATRIQAAFRGHHARKSMNDRASSQQSDEPTKEQLQAEFREDDLGRFLRLFIKCIFLATVNENLESIALYAICNLITLFFEHSQCLEFIERSICIIFHITALFANY